MQSVQLIWTKPPQSDLHKVSFNTYSFMTHIVFRNFANYNGESPGSYNL